MFCTNCGNKLVDVDVFCTSCGKKIVATQHTEEKAPTYINSVYVARPGLLIAAEVLDYVIGGWLVLVALCSIADDFICSVFVFLIGGGLVALPLFMRRGGCGGLGLCILFAGGGGYWCFRPLPRMRQ